MQLCADGDINQYKEKKGIKFFPENDAIYLLKQIGMGFEKHWSSTIGRFFSLLQRPTTLPLNSQTFW